MHQSPKLILALTICLLGSFVRSDTCMSCTAINDCHTGFYCCDGQCTLWPAIGEACPCSQCPSGLACIGGICVHNGLNCSCTTVSDCTVSNYQNLIPDCVDNKCQLVPSSPPFSYFTPGGTCEQPYCQSGFCNTNNECDYNPIGTACTSTYYCQPGSGCFDNVCQPLKALGEECQYDLQCPSGYACRPPSSILPAICSAKGEAGEYCDYPFACNLMDCINNVCTHPTRGEQCYNGECGPEETCGYEYTCIEKNSLVGGERCTKALDCQSSLCNGQCLPISTFGGYCNVSAQCPNGHCVNNTCFRVAFYGEKCNSTHACFDTDHPCRDGLCPLYYSAIGEPCVSDADCAVGRCASGVCDYPLTCQVPTDCGRNLACDCGECKFLRDNAPNGDRYHLYYPFYVREYSQLMTRSPERDCLANMVVNSQCESVIAKYYCYQTCYLSYSFPNAIPSNYNIDCASLQVLSLNATRQPCCSADSQTDCADAITNCFVFNENQIRPFITRPSAPVSAPQATPPTAGAPQSTPSGTTPQAPTANPPADSPQSTPSASSPQSVPSSAPTSTPTAPSVPSSSPTRTPSNTPIAAPLAPPTSSACNCAQPTPLCDRELSACVGLRVTPVVQCVEFANNQYTAYMTYINEQSSSVLMSDAINFLNVNVQDKVSQFEPGRPFTYPQSAFNVLTTSAQQVSWYLDGFKLAFDIAAEELRCPQDVTFQMTSTASIDELLAISDSLVGNLSEVMQVTRSRLNVTFSASTKRQATSSVITVVVKADQSSSETSSQVVLEFVETGFAAFTSRVPAAAVASVSTVPPSNEQSGSTVVTPPMTNPTTVSAPSDRGFISSSTVVLANFALLGCALCSNKTRICVYLSII